MESQEHTNGLRLFPDRGERTGSTWAPESRIVTVPNTQGLHARPVMQFADVAGRFQASIQVKKGSRVVDGKNPMEMMLLEATQGTQLEILAQGADASGALEALVKLVENGFDEA